MPVMKLRAEDGPCWIYRGEGAANIVLAYRGPNVDLGGKVLRLRKTTSHSPQPVVVEEDKVQSVPYLSEHEQLLWAEWPDVAKATSVASLGHAYARDVICPLLGSEHVDPGIPVYASREFLEAVNARIYRDRPSWRREQGSLQIIGGMALLISDHSGFPALPKPVDYQPVISVEIKPKCGFLPEARLLGENNSVKGLISRFILHQHLKHVQGKVATLSTYSPPDLFSGARDRMLKAVEALFETPQNNLAIFVDGIKVFGNAVETKNGEDPSAILERSLEPLTRAEGKPLVEVLQRLITDLLYHSDVLKRLLAAQRLDVLDIEGSIHAFYTFLGQPCRACEEYSKNHAILPQVPDAPKLHSLGWEECKSIVRDYLISATAKDCGLMLTFQALSDHDDSSPHTVFESSSANRKYRYKMFFLDLDLKPLKKMPYYYKLDQEIVQAFIRDHQDGDVTDNTVPR